MKWNETPLRRDKCYCNRFLIIYKVWKYHTPANSQNSFPLLWVIYLCHRGNPLFNFTLFDTIIKHSRDSNFCASCKCGVGEKWCVASCSQVHLECVSMLTGREGFELGAWLNLRHPALSHSLILLAQTSLSQLWIRVTKRINLNPFTLFPEIRIVTPDFQ